MPTSTTICNSDLPLSTNKTTQCNQVINQDYISSLPLPTGTTLLKNNLPPLSYTMRDHFIHQAYLYSLLPLPYATSTTLSNSVLTSSSTNTTAKLNHFVNQAYFNAFSLPPTAASKTISNSVLLPSTNTGIAKGQVMWQSEAWLQLFIYPCKTACNCSIICEE